jgi:hypothetical protein
VEENADELADDDREDVGDVDMVFNFWSPVNVGFDGVDCDDFFKAFSRFCFLHLARLFLNQTYEFRS